MTGWQIRAWLYRVVGTGSRRHRTVRALAAVLLVSAPQPAITNTLTLDACLSLWRQTNAAKRNGLDGLMAQGPEGAAERLSKEQLAKIEAHITALEQLKFRCRQFVPPPPGATVP